jgi:ABC-type multidrug transport system ATPase subunit
MNELMIETSDLTKRYGDNTAVNRLTMRVRRGDIYGFLGANGAGKTTTLRMLLGLVKSTSGRATVLGSSPGSRESLSRIGALVEAPGFYPFLSARDNLRVLTRHAGIGDEQIHEVLDRVGLVDRADDRFATFSQGMKQRLGVAAALLKDPELLILDEPTNGLDPAGMAEMRGFIRGLGQEGRTVILSSHLMAEVEQVCNRVGVIRRGALVREGTVDELRGASTLRVRAHPLQQAARLASTLRHVDAVTTDDGVLQITTNPETAAEINSALVGAGISVSELRADRASLEEVFLDLTRHEQEERR